jgi:hypothetical protein
MQAFDDRFQAELGWNYSRKLLIMGREDAGIM